MKKIILLLVFTLVLITAFGLSSFAQRQDIPEEEPPMSTGPVLTIDIFSNDYTGSISFNATTGEVRSGNLYFFTGGNVIVTSFTGNFYGEYRGFFEPYTDYYYWCEGFLTYKLSHLGPEYSLTLDGSNSISLPFPGPLE